MNLIDKAAEIMRNENGEVGNLKITEKLVTIPPKGEALIIGDLHGDLQSLSTIIEKSAFLNRMKLNHDNIAIFLGDYGDRGPNSTEVYYTVLSLKIAFPKQIILLRGNHEGPTALLPSPHDLPAQLQLKFKQKWVTANSKIHLLFNHLYNGALVEERYLMVHGGLPTKLRNLQEIAQADALFPEKTFLEELLWNDPEETIQGTYPSPRGAGTLFGETITKEILQKLNAKILIRGHEPANEGFKLNHGDKILTLFSRKGPPYNNRNAAYLDMPLSEKNENAKQLLPYIHQF